MSNVFDASALLVALRKERGFERVRDALESDAGSVISAVNWAEVLSKLAEHGEDPDNVSRRLVRGGMLGQGLNVRELDEAQAREIARLRPLTRQLGLSIGDRACLALARTEGGAVLTADRAWETLDVGVQIVRIR